MTIINEVATVAIFNFENHAVRTLVDEQGTPLFVAKDVASALGYTEVSRAVRQHCKGGAKHTPLESAGGTQQMRVIYEPDVYRLIFGSKLESAKKFQDWVFEEVLPTIRNTGGYVVDRYLEAMAERLARMEGLFNVRVLGDVHPNAVDNDEEKQALLHQRKNWKAIYDLKMQGLNDTEISIKLGLERSGIGYSVRRMRACGILPPDARKIACDLEKSLITRHQSQLI